ncbi:MAG: thiamine pyrophosphate-dependent dehydrogenase E1 component subunit alpha [Roseiflexus sp.]|nr:thiamine pyrophosphate-dependent dehydrogenase E1 component subunit alpha [Roseiflexus sp.]MCS7287716.1 thiamine pyrophosphate-dependent dehydrogenase E1 component subunit alpha [Roseiflexus sp.]MDW8147915.1 thiamine pyrophosphate-dependent dehydrogenase E1 component subunit alpha [Roseiflexaceae bacterium]MDW8231950.1 thiamine pyrophosphate-dependent dehydrogenase E1 component subunit alpha [Roseiflexaceae bacterium]
MEPNDTPPHIRLGLSRQRLIAGLRIMIASRETDDRLWLLNRQGLAHFVVTAAGHEATQLGCAWAIRVGHDYVIPYYRDMTLVMALGQSVLDILLHAMARRDDPSSGGRQMFGHYSSRRLRIVSGSSSVGSHLVHAAGLGLAFRARGEQGIAVMGLFGEGATAEGAWHEGLTIAGIHQLPVVFVCENNQYSISVPLHREVPVPDVAMKAAGYGMQGVVVDGNDVFAVYEAAHQAMERARNGGGPTLLECKTYRLRPHSSADDDRKYRSREEVESWRARDPIKRFEHYLVEHGIITPEEIEALRREVRAEVDAATDAAIAAPWPSVESIADHLYG